MSVTLFFHISLVVLRCGEIRHQHICPDTNICLTPTYIKRHQHFRGWLFVHGRVIFAQPWGFQFRMPQFSTLIHDSPKNGPAVCELLGKTEFDAGTIAQKHDTPPLRAAKIIRHAWIHHVDKLQPLVINGRVLTPTYTFWHQHSWHQHMPHYDTNIPITTDTPTFLTPT